MPESAQPNRSDELLRQQEYQRIIEQDRDLDFSASALRGAIAGLMFTLIIWPIFFIFVPISNKLPIFLTVIIFSAALGFIIGKGIYLYEDDALVRTFAGISAFGWLQVLLVPFTIFIFSFTGWLIYELPRSSPGARYAIAIVIVPAISIALFIIRKYLRVFYGSFEAFSGFLIVTYKSIFENNSQLTEPNFIIAMLTAGVYLMVRGFDNIDVGLKDRRKQKEEKKLRLQALVQSSSPTNE